MTKEILNKYKIGDTIDLNCENGFFAYNLEVIKVNSRTIYAQSNIYGDIYKLNKNTGNVTLDSKEMGILKNFKKLYNEKICKQIGNLILP